MTSDIRGSLRQNGLYFLSICDATREAFLCGNPLDFTDPAAEGRKNIMMCDKEEDQKTVNLKLRTFFRIAVNWH